LALPRSSITTWKPSGIPFAVAQTSVATLRVLTWRVRASSCLATRLSCDKPPYTPPHRSSAWAAIGRIPCEIWPCHPFLGFSSPAMLWHHGSLPSALPRSRNGPSFVSREQFLFPVECLRVVWSIVQHVQGLATFCALRRDTCQACSILTASLGFSLQSSRLPLLPTLRCFCASSAMPSLLFLGGPCPCGSLSCESLDSTSRGRRFVAGGHPVLHGCRVDVPQERVLQAGIQGFFQREPCASSTEAVKLSRSRTTLLGVPDTLQGLTS